MYDTDRTRRIALCLALVIKTRPCPRHELVSRALEFHSMVLMRPPRHEVEAVLDMPLVEALLGSPDAALAADLGDGEVEP